MPVNFPDSPTLNQTYTSSGVTWRWDGTVWTVTGNNLNIGATGATGITGATGPVAGADTQVIYNSAGAAAGSANLTFASNQLNVHGITIGRGAGAVATNTALGASALAANTSGDRNTAVGYVSMASNTIGWNNAAFGRLSLNANTSGDSNAAFGSVALYLNTTGGSNAAIGYASLASNTTGSTNTGLGTSALYSNTTASNNTAVGNTAAYTNTTGANNVAIGASALFSNTTDFGVVAVGFRALYSNTTGSGGSYNVGIGYDAMYSNTTGYYNVGVGRASLYSNSTGNYNVAIGQQALNFNTTANNNTAVGYQAGYSNTTGASNTFVGHTAGYTSNYNGLAYNTGIGERAGYSLTTGTINTFIGSGAGYYVTSGDKNTIVGRYSGNQGGLDIRTASNYIVLSDGDGNPRMYSDGSGRFYVNATAAGSGTASRFSVNVNNNESGITYGLASRITDIVYPGTDNMAAIYAEHRGFGTKYGVYSYVSTVGYGTSYAGYFLCAGGPSSDTYGVYAESTQTDTNGPAVAYGVFANAKTTIGIANSGYSVGVMSQTANYLKNINYWAKSLYTGASTQTVLLVTRNGSDIGSISTSTTATAYNTSSDYRMKDNQAPLTGSGEFIDALQPKTWNWKINGSKGVGFIAHEAQAVSPSSVIGEKDAVDADNKPIMQAMEYGSAEFIANIVAELQSLRKRVAQLESK